MDLIAYLTSCNVSFEHLEHPEKFTSQEVAAAQHVPGAEMVKSVLVNADAKFVLAILSANHRVNFDRLAKALGAGKVTLAAEKDLTKLFPDAEVGAEPPFGTMYNVPTIVDEHLTTQTEIVCQAGTHHDTVKLAWTDYAALENPQVGDFGDHI